MVDNCQICLWLSFTPVTSFSCFYFYKNFDYIKESCSNYKNIIKVTPIEADIEIINPEYVTNVDVDINNTHLEQRVF